MGRCYPRLTFEERRKIAKWREAKMPVPEIADRLSRAPSTIYRELRRNPFEDNEMSEPSGYRALVTAPSSPGRSTRSAARSIAS